MFILLSWGFWGCCSDSIYKRNAYFLGLLREAITQQGGGVKAPSMGSHGKTLRRKMEAQQAVASSLASKRRSPIRSRPFRLWGGGAGSGGAPGRCEGKLCGMKMGVDKLGLGS